MNKDFAELTPYEKEALFDRLKLNWTYNSNAIEGNTLSLSNTEFIIKSGLTISGKSIDEHNQVLGHYRALDFIFGLLDKDIITREDLFELHRIIQTQILIDYERPTGAYKVVPNGRWLTINEESKHYYYPSPEDTPYLMSIWLNKFGEIGKQLPDKDEAIKVYIDMHLSFTAIHPFFDGNGRMGRLLANLPLLKNGYLPIIVNNRHRVEYIELLGNYNIKSKELNANSIELIDKNEYYHKILSFFNDEYQYSKDILDELIKSKNRK